MNGKCTEKVSSTEGRASRLDPGAPTDWLVVIEAAAPHLRGSLSNSLRHTDVNSLAQPTSPSGKPDSARLGHGPTRPSWDLGTVVAVVHTPVPLSGCPSTLLQLSSGPGTPRAPQRSCAVLPNGDRMLVSPGRSSGLWHFLGTSWLKATPARPRGLAHLSWASMKARCGAQPSRKWARS